MRGNRLTVAALAVALAFSPSLAFAQVLPPAIHHSHPTAIWWFMACPGSVVAAASAKNWRRHQELTAEEAWTCGLLYWWNEGSGKYGY